MVFWGVTEFHHLVNIVNQIDLVDHPNEESRMGQLMAHLTWTADWGTLEFFAMPLHRKRTLPRAPRRRLRPDVPFDERRVSYESGAQEWHVDLAVRYSRSAGPLDLGLSVFDGTSREPSFNPKFQLVPVRSGTIHPRTRQPDPALLAQIRQYGLDAQLTIESWLIKLEALYREGARNRGGPAQPVRQGRGLRRVRRRGRVHLRRGLRFGRRYQPAGRMEL